MRLLIDEMYPPTIAHQPPPRPRRGCRHRATELRSLPDIEVFVTAQAERRAVVSENVAGFIGIAGSFDRRVRHITACC